MFRIWRLTALAVGAALLGLAASALVGARLCHILSTTEIVTAAAAPAAAPPAPPEPCTSPSCLPEGADEPQDAFGTVAAFSDPMDPTDAPAATSRRARGPRRHRPGASADTALLDELGRGITRLGRHRYQIRPSTLARALGDLRWLHRVVRVAPATREGKPIGFRVVWVKAEGPLAKLGLRGDDVLATVNGLDIATPDRALEAYGQLKAARRLVLGLLREGRRVSIEYVIR